MNEEKRSGEALIDKRARIRRFLHDFYHIKVRTFVGLCIVLVLVLLDTTASAQNETESFLDRESTFEENGVESRTTEEADETVSSETATLEPINANRTDLTLSEFLFAIRIGPFFSFGLWTGLLGELEFEFKLHDRGYLCLITGINGGYQIEYERGDYLFSETLGYRLYFPNSPDNAWTLFGGLSFGYFTTTRGTLERTHDWLHLGFKAKGGYYFLTNQRLSIGIDLGFSLAYQLNEFIGAADFLVAIPDLSLTLLF